MLHGRSGSPAKSQDEAGGDLYSRKMARYVDIALVVSLDRHRRMAPVASRIKQELREEYNSFMKVDYLELLQERASRARMAAGPYLVDVEDWPTLLDAPVLVVPSSEKRSAAVRTWKRGGFTWHWDTASWVRDTSKPLKGKVYSPEKWLRDTRSKFYRLWPEFREQQKGVKNDGNTRRHNQDGTAGRHDLRPVQS